MKRIVITGGTYAGKTSVIRRLEQDGFSVVPDLGLELIAQLNHELGKDAQRQFRTDNPEQFYAEIVKRQLAYEAKVTDSVVIFDRGVHDYIAMMQLKNIRIPTSLSKLVKGVSYDIAFVLDTLLAFDTRSATGRSLTEEESIHLKKLVANNYEKLGCMVVFVPEMPLEDRSEHIKKYILSEV